MRNTRQLLTVAVALLAGVGLVCAQVCDVGCAFAGGPAGALARAANDPAPPAHCHQQETEPVENRAPGPLPGQGEHSKDCQGHTHPAELIQPGAGITKAAQPEIPLPAVETLPIFVISYLGSDAGLSRSPSSESPPIRAVVTALRI